MQFPIQIQIGNLSLPLHTLLESAGIFIGFRYFLYLRRKKGDIIDQPKRMWIIIGAIFGALLGSRLAGALEDPVAWFNSPHPLLYFYQNKTVVGGFLGGLIGVETIKKFISEKHSSGDLFVYPMILALIIGRIGCFSMGIYEETYGTPTSLLTGMDLGDGILRHPVTLYEITFLILLWITFKRVNNIFVLQHGALYKLFMISYVSFRFLLDFIKPHYTFFIGLSTIQIICLAGIVYYLPYILKPQKLFAAYA